MRHARDGWLIVVLLLVAPLAAAEDAGREELDQAIAAKLSAESFSDFDRVITLCERALDKGLEGEPAALARRLIAGTSYERAKLLTGMIMVDRPDPRWRELRATALEDLERATEHAPELTDAWRMTAQLELLPGGNHQHARKSLDKLLEVAGDDKKMKFDAHVMRAATESSPEERVADLEAAIELRPEEPIPLRMRGALHLMQEKYDEALKDFDAALALDEKHAATHEARGRVLEVLGRFDDARAAFDRAVELEPTSIDALLERAQVGLLDEKFEDTIAGATKILDLDSQNVPALLLRAQASLMLGKLEESLADADKVVRLKPDLPQGHLLRADALIRDERFGEAITELETIRPRNTEGSVELNFKLALLYRAQRNFRKAIELLDAAIAANPDNGMLHSSRADSLLSIGKHREAIVDLDRATELRPTDTSVLNNLAWLLATSPEDELRDGKRAVTLAEKACELTEHKQAHILSTLAAAYAETGDFDNAKKWSAKAVELADENNLPQLKKELASYEEEKPWRERLTEESQPAPSSARIDRPRRRRD